MKVSSNCVPSGAGGVESAIRDKVWVCVSHLCIRQEQHWNPVHYQGRIWHPCKCCFWFSAIAPLRFTNNHKSLGTYDHYLNQITVMALFHLASIPAPWKIMPSIQQKLKFSVCSICEVFVNIHHPKVTVRDAHAHDLGSHKWDILLQILISTSWHSSLTIPQLLNSKLG